MAYTPNGIVLEAFSFEADTFTRYISGNPDPVGIVGKAVALDPTAPGTVRLAGSGDVVYGRIYQFEDRKQEGVQTVSVERRFVKRLPKATATVVAVGDMVEGDGAGLVRTAVTPNLREPNTVIQVESDYVVVEKL